MNELSKQGDDQRSTDSVTSEPSFVNWVDAGTGLRRRRYSDYQQYIDHQSDKLQHIESDWLPEYERLYEMVLFERLHEIDLQFEGKSALCLGARLGAEVRVLLKLGCFAVGVDLNPGKSNDFVLHGDFHKLQFANESVDIVFSNALDHAFDLSLVIFEVNRVLKLNGFVLIELMNGSQEGKWKDFYDCFHWERIDDVLTLFDRAKFRVKDRRDFQMPWPGQQLILSK